MPQVLDVAIVGAGISGIGMAAHLARDCPGKTFALFERRAAPGGTWDLFRYPGVRSDSDMFTFSYAFAPWGEERAIAPGSEILAYLQRVADENGVSPHIRLGHKVCAANWDSAAGLWNLSIEGPDGPLHCAARWLIMGSGYYDYDSPHDAGIAGLERFAGRVIHPQFWPQELDWAGQRVAVIGSGATAATLVPALAEKAAHVVMVQRTPSWFIARPATDRFANWARRFLPARWAHLLMRHRNQWIGALLFRRARQKPQEAGNWLKEQMRQQVGGAWNEADFSPPYGPWEQRLCFVPDGDMFAALREGRASVVTGAIATVDETGLLMEDGRHVDADLIITATGLRVLPLGKVAVSVDGAPLTVADHFWYRDAMLSNVPNFAALFGYLNGSWTMRIDIVADRLCRLIRQMDHWGLDVATPTLPADHKLTEVQPFDMFSSGYLQRGKHLIPKSASTAPWRIHMDYSGDAAELARDPLDDGWLVFARAPRAPAPDAADTTDASGDALPPLVEPAAPA